MNKITTLFSAASLALAASISLVACGDDSSSAGPDETLTSSSEETVLSSRYLQRSEESMSTKTALQSEEQLMRLHQEKMDCFLGLSRGTTEQERQDFIAYDLKKEKDNVGKA